MRAAVVGPPGGRFTIEELPDPEPGEGEVVARVGRCGICGSDLNMTSGCSPPGLNAPAGSVIGHEWAGEVVAVGPGVERLKLGDRIAGLCGVGCGHCAYCQGGEPLLCRSFRMYLGGYGQYAVSHERGSMLLPKTLSIADGALAEPLAVALHGVRMAEIAPESRVLVIGAGAIGLGAIFWAARQRPAALVAASRSERRAEMAVAMGADAFVTTGQGQSRRIAEALGGPPDIVIEAVGAPGMLETCIQLVRPKGRVVSLGFCMSPDAITPAFACMKQVQLHFPVVYTTAEFEQAARVLDRDRLPDPRAMITRTVGLDAVPATLDALRGPHDQTKVHIDPWA